MTFISLISHIYLTSSSFFCMSILPIRQDRGIGMEKQFSLNYFSKDYILSNGKDSHINLLHFFLTLTIILEQHIFQSLIKEREGEQEQTENDKDDDTTQGGHLPYIVERQLDKDKSKGNDAEETQFLVVQTHA